MDYLLIVIAAMICPIRQTYREQQEGGIREPRNSFVGQWPHNIILLGSLAIYLTFDELFGMREWWIAGLISLVVLGGCFWQEKRRK
jgi:hypothetical protein